MDDSSFRSDAPPGDDRPYAWLDEWLCEYVDGTMDPPLRAVFEEYMRANPDLKAHVERLEETRDLLCQCGRMPSTACDRKTRADVCGAVEADMLRTSASWACFFENRQTVVVGLTSSVVALVLGLFTGALLFGADASRTGTPPAPPSSVAVEHTNRAPAPPRRSQTVAPPIAAPSSPAGPPSLPASLLPATTDSLPAPVLTQMNAP